MVPTLLRGAALALSFGASLLAPPTFATESLPMTQEETAVLTAIETMTAAFGQGDLDGVMNSYEPGAVIVFEPGKGLSDPEQVRAAFAEFAALNPAFRYGGHQVVVAGDIGLHISPWQMTGTAPDGTKQELGGLSVAVLRRQADGSWRMVIDNPYGDLHLAQ